MEIGESLTKEQMNQLQQDFLLFDKNRDGCITLDELKTVITQQLGSDLTEQQLKEMMREVDANGNQKIEFFEFHNLMFMTFKEETEKNLKEAFQVFDENQDGYISPSELMHVVVMLNLEEKLTEEEVLQMIRDADLNGDGHIDYNEFVKMMTHN